MNIKRVVLFSLALYAIGAFGVLAIGFLYGDPLPGTDPAQSLVNLNNAAQSGIADRTNEQIDELKTVDSDQKAPEKVAPPTQTTTNSQAPATSSSTPSPAPTAAAEPAKPASTPAPTVKLICGTGGTCTTAQVATHNSQSDCWVLYNSKAFNVTSYVSKHPGGSGSFDSSTCGKDITAQLKGQAGSASSPKTKNHPSSAYNTLNSYFVANISN